MALSDNPYPVQFSVDSPEESRDRMSVFLRFILAIPIVILFAAVSGESAGIRSFGGAAGGTLMAGPLLMILFRQKYPKWWFDWNFALSKFTNRVAVYLFMLRDEYPSTDEEQAVHLELPYPDVEQDLSKWLPLIKWFLAIPHYIILAVLWVLVVFAVIISWLSILITGNHPSGLFNFVVGVMRWTNRVGAYAFVLVTDVYPPFRLDP
ncbi:MAG TPA: DUF4389 domain-containing protein [Dehalococcoidia bacterium]|jgi:hypothetical protein|nr:DUF4389 domain-containing protein [Dehalococcoidia bacterium]